MKSNDDETRRADIIRDLETELDQILLRRPDECPYAWRHKETGEFLIVDYRRTHTKCSDTYNFAKDINYATLLPWPPVLYRSVLERVPVIVIHRVFPLES